MKSSEQTDRELIKGCRKGKPKAQEMLYRKYYGYAMGIALRYAPSREEASEILNDSFLKVFQSVENFDLEKSFKPWLGRIVVNTAISKFRSEKKHMYQSEIEEAHQVRLDEDILDCMAAEEIIRLLQLLPDIYRITFNLYELEGYSHKEIAGQLGISEGTSRSNLSRAKSKLQKLVNEHYRYERA
ncbi:MAG: RNA polymerase sigma factor [Flammeovirgaceae bacterium]